MPAWTADEDARLRANARTLSASQIAAMLPGRSRASVISRAWRLGAGLGKDETTRRALEHPRQPEPRRSRPPSLAPAPADSWPSASLGARRAALCVRPRMVSLEQLAHRQCRWPYGEEPVRYCGHPAEAGGSYCEAHRGIAYIPEQSPYDTDALAAAIDRRDERIRRSSAQRG
jgi:hypothetical protein